jgi:hypothetical protein
MPREAALPLTGNQGSCLKRKPGSGKKCWLITAFISQQHSENAQRIVALTFASSTLYDLMEGDLVKKLSSMLTSFL